MCIMLVASKYRVFLHDWAMVFGTGWSASTSDSAAAAAAASAVVDGVAALVLIEPPSRL